MSYYHEGEAILERLRASVDNDICIDKDNLIPEKLDYNVYFKTLHLFVA